MNNKETIKKIVRELFEEIGDEQDPKKQFEAIELRLLNAYRAGFHAGVTKTKREAGIG